jgi:DNA-binding NarL/FixJ family response regulator
MNEGPSARVRLLFVDDEINVLDALAASLRRMRKVWDMHFACGGQAAVGALQTSRFDAVITDMRMPGIDGEAVLEMARTTCPSTVRVILSGQTDREVVLRTVGLAHRFVSKPCNADDLRGILGSLIDASMSCDARSREIVCGVGHLPAHPESLSRLRRLLQMPVPPNDEITDCVERDSALTAKVLHLACAGFLFPPKRASGVSQALEWVGLDALRSLVGSTQSCTDADHAGRGANHWFEPGTPQDRGVDAEHPPTRRALRGLGKLVMLHQLGAAYAALLDRSEADSTQLNRLELEAFGPNHSLIGAHLVNLWGMSEVPDQAFLRS